MSTLLYNSKHRHATWLELFFDLIFVVLIGRVTHLLAHVHHGHLSHLNVVKFPLVFVPIWWLWANHTLYANVYDSDSKTDRFMTLLCMLLMVGMSVYIDLDFETENLGLITLFSSIRIILGIQYFLSRNRHQNHSDQSVRSGVIYVMTALLGQMSLIFDGWMIYVVVYASVFLDVLLPMLFIKQKSVLKVHKEHLVERVGLLTIILLGESVISIVNSIQGVEWNMLRILAFVSGTVLIGSIWWILFDFYYLLEESEKLKNPYVIIIPNLFMHMGLAIIANVIRHAILNDLILSEFKMLTFIGVLVFFLGKQIPYSYVAPKIRKKVIQNTLMVFILILCSLFIGKAEVIMALTALTVLLYIASTFRYMITLKVASKHIKGNVRSIE